MGLAERRSCQQKLRRQVGTGLEHRADAVQGFVGDLVVTCWAGGEGSSRVSGLQRRRSKLRKTSGGCETEATPSKEQVVSSRKPIISSPRSRGALFHTLCLVAATRLPCLSLSICFERLRLNFRSDHPTPSMLCSPFCLECSKPFGIVSLYY